MEIFDLIQFLEDLTTFAAKYLKEKTEDSFFLECHARLCYASANLVNVKCYQEKSRLKKPQKSISQLQKKKRSAFYPFLTSFAKLLRLPKNRFEYTYAVFIISYFFHENIIELGKLFTVIKES